jgi:hypothetical protein
VGAGAGQEEGRGEMTLDPLDEALEVLRKYEVAEKAAEK